jgi:hypothetical protein
MYLNHVHLRSVLSGAGLGSQKQRSRPKSGQEHAVVGVAVVDIALCVCGVFIELYLATFGFLILGFCAVFMDIVIWKLTMIVIA